MHKGNGKVVPVLN